MNDPQRIFVLAAVLTAGGIWLLLPHGRKRMRMFGGAACTVGLTLWFAQIPPLAQWLNQSIFTVLAAFTLMSAVATISLSKPVYSAIWFAMTLLGTAGLLMVQGAQFLAVAVVVVYAGAILVTFLFVLMLAQPEGKAPYDRVSWEALLSATTGAVMTGVLTVSLFSAFAERKPGDPLPPPTTAELQAKVLSEAHVAQLGGELFGRHLLAVQVVGVLLMAALVGAAAVVSPRVSRNPSPASGRGASNSGSRSPTL